jgi:hypothetical protein
MPIINGSFDTDISGWTPSGNGDYDIIWDTGRARLRVYRCSNVYLEQTFIIDSNTISFDWQTAAGGWYELGGWELIVGSTPVINEILPYLSQGTRIADTSPYIGQIAIIKFSIIQSIYCGNSDHNNTYLYIDNVQLFSGLGITAATTPSTTSCMSPCDITVDVTWTNGGTISRSFYPAIKVNTTRIPLVTPEVLTVIGPELSSTKSFIISGLTRGTYTICADPH